MCLGENAVNARGQRRMARMLWADRMATVIQLTTEADGLQEQITPGATPVSLEQETETEILLYTKTGQYPSIRPFSTAYPDHGCSSL